MARPAVASVLCLLLLAGCSDGHEHSRLGLDSPQAAKIKQMADKLRSAGEAGLDGILQTDAAADLPQAKAKMLRGTLLELIQADSVELKQIDEFGPNVLRAIFELKSDGETATLATLLIVTDDDQIRWAGRN